MNSKIIFLTALNSIQISLASSMQTLGIKSAIVTLSNVEKVMNSDATVIFVGPEVLKTPLVTQILLKWRKSFILKVVDEVHLCKTVSEMLKGPL